MPSAMKTTPFGPWPRGLIDRANPSDLSATAGALRRMRGVVFSGGNRLAVRPGTVTVMTLFDDQGSPAPVTTVCAVQPFTNVAIAVGHSTVTNKAYVYQLAADLTGWFNNVGALQSNLSASPAAVLWTGMTTPPDVSIAEGLGVAYIAMNAAISATTLAFPMLQFTPPATVANVLSNLDNVNGNQPIYALGCIGFQQHLWIWGFGAGITAVNGYRPELLRFCQPVFTLPFEPSDSLTVGDRVRSVREQVVAAAVAGGSLFVGTPFSMTRITGYGRDTWFKEPLDKSYGVSGLKAMTVRGDTVYYWSNRGPLRCQAAGIPEPLWQGLETAILSLINPQRIIAGYDLTSDVVMFFYDGGQGVRTWAGFDCTRDVWVGPDDDIGLVIVNAGNVAPIFASTVNAPAGSVGPAGPPSSPTTTSIGAVSAIANWVSGDTSAQTSVEYRRQGDVQFIATLVSPGVTVYQFAGLQAGVAYEWRAAHVKGGQLSSYVGPVSGSQFTTATTVLPPTNFLVLQAGQGPGFVDIGLIWLTGEPGVNTFIDMQIGGFYVPVQVVNAPASSGVVRVTASGTYSFKINQFLTTVPNGSPLVGPQSITVTVT